MPAKTFRHLFVLSVVMFLVSQAVPAQSTAFTYQGKLTDSGNLANATYDMQFKLFDAAINGNQIGPTLTFDGTGTNPPAVSVTSGIFTVTIDFGACSPASPCFNGNPRFLDIAVRVHGVGSYAPLTPRQPFTSTPHAMKTQNLTFNGPFDNGAGTSFTATNTFTGESGGLNTTPNPSLTSPFGKFNAFYGAGAGRANTTGFENAFFGYHSGRANTLGNINAFFGEQAGQANTIGDGNAFFGAEAGLRNTNGMANAFFGVSAGSRTTTGDNNTFIGSNADFDIANPNGDENTLLGYNTSVSSGVSNGTAIGAFASVTQSNSLVLGNNANVGIGTTAPEAKFHVSGGSMLLDNNQGLFIKSTTNVQKRVLFADSSDILRIGSGGTSGFDQVSVDLATPGTVMTMLPTGNVGIGTTEPSFRLHIIDSSNAGLRVQTNITGGTVASFGGVGDFQIDAPFIPAGRFIIKENGNVGVGTTGPDQLLTVNGNASKPGGGSWATFSDTRLKNIHGNYTRGLKALMQLQPIRFEYKPDNALGLRGAGEYVGFSAQEVEGIVPEAVTRSASGYLQINNDPILWTMLNAVKEQQVLISSQQERLNSQQAQTEDLQRQVSQQQQLIKQQQKQVEALKRLVCKSNPDEEVCKP